MKRIITILIMLSIFLMCMTACSGNDATPTIYDQLDSLATKSYRSVDLRVVTTTGDVQLLANYSLTQNNISYSVEKLNTLPSDGNLAGVSPECKTTYTGSAKIVDGKVTEFDGDAVTLPSYDELRGAFNFDEVNLTNVVIQNNSLNADVTSPSSFLGSSVDAKNMEIEVEYTTEALSKVTITYQTNKSTVLVEYEFKI